MDAAQKEHELHKGIANSLNQEGHNVSEQDLNPQDHSSLTRVKELLGDDTTHVIDSGFKELMGGVGGTTRDREMKSKIPLSIATIRDRLKLRKKAA